MEYEYIILNIIHGVKSFGKMACFQFFMFDKFEITCNLIGQTNTKFYYFIAITFAEAIFEPLNVV